MEGALINCHIIYYLTCDCLSWVRVITGSDRIGGNYRIGPNFPLVYEFLCDYSRIFMAKYSQTISAAYLGTNGVLTSV